MNLDFDLEPLFSWYVVLLCLSGVVMVALAAIKAGDRSVASRALSAVAGLGFLGYGIYLGFIFDGGSYMMFFQAFILPALLVVNFVRSLAKNHQTEPQPYPEFPMQPHPGAPTQAQPYQAGSAQPHQPYANGPMQQYPAQPQPYPADPTQPRPTQPS